ncbi:HBL148Wp [Eremothecium sinecaudum]|uniref:HBL148Wp n=1 Tax=Eremothecium sinecaudum TaxID=45286 RepID=A0A120K0W2_9SACH|nr:HBL148Wp [Eremothecium sinecaudum]AMD18754.1 HBL148Wp [Eremothecium sinecaudum]
MGHTSGAVDPIFGQSKVFDCSDEAVNPLAVQYLQNVRNEALCIHAVGARNLRTKGPKTNISYSDDEIEDNNKPKSVGFGEGDPISLPFDMDETMKWFDRLQESSQEPQEPFEGYTEETLDLLLYSLKQYISETAQDSDPGVCKLAKILEEVEPVQNNTSFELDAAWAGKLIARLKRRTFTSLENLKLKINSQLPVPTRSQAWKIHISLNEPTNEFFQRMSHDQLLQLLTYMVERFEDQIFSEVATEHAQWLLYLLLHLPRRLAANHVSQVRSLAKVARKLIQNNSSDLQPLVMPLELTEDSPPSPGTTICHLTLTVAAIVYGQRDLLFND